VRRAFFLFIMSFLLLSTGCVSAIKEKFTRKPRQSRASVVKASDEDVFNIRRAYERHFIFAKVWMDEINVALDGESAKRVKDALANAIENLTILQRYFEDALGSPAVEIDDYIKGLKGSVESALKKKRRREPITRFKNKIEHIRIEFHKKFLPSKQPSQLWKTTR